MSQTTPYSIGVLFITYLLFKLTLLIYRSTLASPFLFIPDDELSSKSRINSKPQYIVVFLNNLLMISDASCFGTHDTNREFPYRQNQMQ